MRTILVGLAISILSAPAAADNIVIAGDPVYPGVVREHRPIPTRFDSRLGLMLGGADVGDANGFSLGLHAGLGYRVGDTTVFGEYGYFRVGDGKDEAMSRNGRTSRLGLAVRRSVMNTDPREKVGGDLWVEVGAGYERVSWSQGGLLYRPDLALGFGFEFDGRPGPRADVGAGAPPRHLGWFMAFRAILGRAPDASAMPATCGGPCTEATSPSRNDTSLYFVVGLHWGRNT
jgi:hypothetical protein